jgi:tRNAThr (cytosine32-N3)-methyltransferase
VGNIKAGVWDLSSDQLPEDLEPESVDIAVFVFVLSALHPDEWFTAVKNVHRVWSPPYQRLNGFDTLWHRC